MNTEEVFNIYIDYLIVSMGKTTATGLSELMNNAITHDKITRSLSEPEYTSKDLWLKTEKIIRKIESEDGVLIIDDTIIEKEYTDENELICWHHDHCKNRNVKGINMLSALYYNAESSVPVSFYLVHKEETFIDTKTKKEKRRSSITKNEMLRWMLDEAKQNHLKYKYVLTDSWYASTENMMYIKHDMRKFFVMAIKSNRKVAITLKDKLSGKWKILESLELKENTTIEIYFEGVDFPLLLSKKVFTNEDSSIGILYLVSNDLNLDYETIYQTYQKRWKIEEFHKSLKSNAFIGSSPTKTVRTQTNHIFASLCSFLKLESLKGNSNHFAIKAKLYIRALRSAMKELMLLSSMTYGNTINIFNA